MSLQSQGWDVLIVGGGNPSWAGGNSYFTAGAMRCVHGGLSDVLPVVNNVEAQLAEKIDLDPYTHEDFLHDLYRVTDGRYDRDLGRTLVGSSNETVKWLAKHGIRFRLSFNRRTYKIGDRYKFWGGMCLKTQGGGKGQIEDHRTAAENMGVCVEHEVAARSIKINPATGAFEALEAVNKDGSTRTTKAKTVILAAGGFEANPRVRAQYLGHGWDLGHVRGTPYNTGEVLEMAIRDLGARQAGHWSDCHSVAWDADSPANTGRRQGDVE